MALRKPRSLTTTELRNGMSRIFRELSRTGKPVFVERDGHPFAVILSLKEYERSSKKSKVPLAREAFGMWKDRADIDDNWLATSRARWVSEWRNG